MPVRHKKAGLGPVFALAALAVPLSLVVPAALSACGGDDDDDDGARPGQSVPVVSEAAVLLRGGPTDETFRSIVGVPAQTDGGRAAALLSPAAGETMPAATPPTFQWSASQALGPSPSGPSLWGGVWAAIGERSAYAHGTPYSGVAYLLSIASASGAPLLTVVTSQTSFTPDEVAWGAVAEAGGDVQVYLLTARCEQNAVVGGGPLAPAAEPVTLRLVP